MTEEADEDGRPRGVLSGADRGYLREPEDYSRQASHARQEAIRERVENAVLDFSLLFDELDHDERETIFRGRLSPQKRFDDARFEAGIRDALAFLMEGAGGAALLDEDAPTETTAGRILTAALERVGWRWGFDVHDVRVDVDAEKVPVRELLSRLEADDELAPGELAQLLVARGDDVDTEPVQSHLRAALLEDVDGAGE